MFLRRSPYFEAYVEGSQADYQTGCYQFRDFLKTLTQFSADTSGWRVYRSVEDGQLGEGLNPLTEMEAVIEFYRSHDMDGAKDGGSNMIDGNVFRESFGDKSIKYRWGAANGRDTLKLELDDMRHIAPVTLDRYIAIADILIRFRRPRYMWVGDRNYRDKGHAMFDRLRIVANWFAWVPQNVTPAQIPSAHLVQPHLGGTLIVTQPDFFNINDNQPAIDRANAVEYEMNEAGVLPRLIDLN